MLSDVSWNINVKSPIINISDTLRSVADAASSLFAQTSSKYSVCLPCALVHTHPSQQELEQEKTHSLEPSLATVYRYRVGRKHGKQD